MTVSQEMISSLIRQAAQAREKAYAPYSHFQVGAALLAEDGCVYTGCNVECVSYPITQCAERTALCTAVAQGKRKFLAIAVVGAPETAPWPFADVCPPCGACRQMLMEFCRDGRLLCILAKGEKDYQTHWLKDLLPVTFGAAHLH